MFRSQRQPRLDLVVALRVGHQELQILSEANRRRPLRHGSSPCRRRSARPSTTGPGPRASRLRIPAASLFVLETWPAIEIVGQRVCVRPVVNVDTWLRSDATIRAGECGEPDFARGLATGRSAKQRTCPGHEGARILRERGSDGQNRTKRALSLRERQEVQAVLPDRRCADAAAGRRALSYLERAASRALPLLPGET